MARTAVVAGTATAVSGKVRGSQQAKAEAEAAQQQQAPPPEAAVSAPDAEVAQLQQLAALRDQGILTEEEFTAKKAQVLGI